jgi:acetylornithine/N-succinyldiaminopimelate aminotransferase
MKLFDVYPLIPVTIVRAEGCRLWDDKGTEYLDLYGGHAVISIGHSHPHYVKRISEQLSSLGFYSNSIQIPIQQALANKLAEQSCLHEYQLFLVNSGAEANENAIKMASFSTQKSGFISFSGAFHGRTSAAVALTDNPKLIAPCNAREDFHILPWGDLGEVEKVLAKNSIAGILIEGIQGVGGIHVPSPEFLLGLAKLAKKWGVKLILDEVQSGYGRTGRFFAHQWVEGFQPDLITVAKGMGNGFPLGGLLLSPEFKPSYGLLGTTFGGNHVACAAGLAVLEVMEMEKLQANALLLGEKLIAALKSVPGVKDVRGKGLMVGIDLDRDAAPVRNDLVSRYKIFTGSAATKGTIRILPPLSIQWNQLHSFVDALTQALNS